MNFIFGLESDLGMIKHLLELKLDLFDMVYRIKKPKPLIHTFFLSLLFGLEEFQQLKLIVWKDVVTDELVLSSSVDFVADIRF